MLGRLTFLALMLMLPTVALSAQSGSKNKVQSATPTPNVIMGWNLPFLDGQTVYYHSLDTGEIIAYAHRRRLRITFYDINSNLLGEARRVSQHRTIYFDAHGESLGSIIDQKATLQSDAITPKRDDDDDDQ